MGGPLREADPEGRAHVEEATDFDASGMEFHGLLDQGQSDARAVEASDAGGVGLCETVEDAGQILGGHPAAGVCHLHHHMLGRLRKTDGDVAAERELERVGDEILEDAFDLVRVDVYRSDRSALHPQCDGPLLGKDPERTEHGPQETGELDGLVAEPGLAGLHLRQVQELVNEPEQLGGAALHRLETH